jgi:hypothetical protein
MTDRLDKVKAHVATGRARGCQPGKQGLADFCQYSQWM